MGYHVHRRLLRRRPGFVSPMSDANRSDSVFS